MSLVTMGAALQMQGRTSAKALRQECLWPVQGDQGRGSGGDELGEGMGK